MKIVLYYFIALSFISCQNQAEKELSIPISSKDISVINEIVFYKNKRFNGRLFEVNIKNNDTILTQRFRDGRLDGISKKWYPNLQLMEYREYSLGRKNGKQIAFWENGKKRFEFFAKDDAYEGELREWSVNGKLFHVANYTNGQENGKQIMWYENGKIRANYVIINGKRYGLLGTKNCKNVSDSIFIFN
jgi:antitoxin component YwqK of YwqJK toxin-antitoxin module